MASFFSKTSPEKLVPKKDILLLALGGNALIRKGQAGTVEEQLDNLCLPLSQAARLTRTHRLLITHGNGPQVGTLLVQQETCGGPHPLPLEILVAQTQGQIGYMIESTLDSELMQLHGTSDEEGKYIVSLLSYVVVDEEDEAFSAPSKPIGSVLDPKQVDLVPYPTKLTAKGWRRVVASPRPVTIVEKREIQKLIDEDFIVICCGGGGIPVVRNGRKFCGVDAVIDKDLASAKLALETGVDIFCIATDVAGAYLNYQKPNERFLRRLLVSEAEQHLRVRAFPEGSMGPKIEACVEFLKGGGKRAVITGIDAIEDAVAGEAGTEIVLG